MQRRLQPLTGPDFALVAEPVLVRPTSLTHHQRNCLFDLTLVGIAAIDHRHWHTMSAEHQLGPFGIRESAEGLVDAFDERIQIKRMTVERLNQTKWKFLFK